jgi:colanic acid/amylovoran biosynthesis glycosyltransferase
MAKYKVAIVFDHYPNEAQYSWRAIGEWLSQNTDWEVRMFLNENKPFKGFVNIKEQNQLKRFFFRFFNTIKNHNNSKTLSQFQPLIEFRPDIVHLINAQNFPRLLTVLDTINPSIVFTFRGYDTLVRPFTDKEWRESLNTIYTKSKALHFVSDYIKDAAIGLGADRKKCFTIYQSINSTEFSNTIDRKRKDTVNIISTGRLTWEKGYIYGLEAIAILIEKNYNIKYTIFGDGPDLNLLQYHIRRLNLTNHCFLAGKIPITQIKEELTKADIFFHPSLSDALPNSLIEASSMGVPIVSTTAGGIPEVVVHNQTGFLAPPASVEELVQYLEILIEDEIAATRMGSNGRTYILQKFTKDSERTQWEAIYRQVLPQS